MRILYSRNCASMSEIAILRRLNSAMSILTRIAYV